MSLEASVIPVRALLVLTAVVTLAACQTSSPDTTSSEPPRSDAVPMTLDEALQRSLRTVAGTGDSRFVAAALVVDVQRDQVVAYVQSDGRRTMMDAQRPSGSTLKLLVDVAAAQAGVLADDGVAAGVNCLISGVPEGESDNDPQIAPVISIRDANAASVNCAFAKLTLALGPERLRQAALDLGIERPLNFGPRFAFGANTVSLRELAAIATTIANGGFASTVADLLESTSVPVSTSAEPQRVLDPTVASQVVDMTSTVLTAGTAQGWALDGRGAFAKTGTAEANTDAWIVGGTPQYVAVVWMGNPTDPTDSMRAPNVTGVDRVRGGNLPGRVFHEILEFAHEGLPIATFNHAEATRGPVIVVAPTIDCIDGDRRIAIGGDGPTMPWVPAGGPIDC